MMSYKLTLLILLDSSLLTVLLQFIEAQRPAVSSIKATFVFVLHPRGHRTFTCLHILLPNPFLQKS